MKEKILTKHSDDRVQRSPPAAANYRCGWCCSWRCCLRWNGIPFSHDFQFTFAFKLLYYLSREFVALYCTHGWYIFFAIAQLVSVSIPIDVYVFSENSETKKKEIRVKRGKFLFLWQFWVRLEEKNKFEKSLTRVTWSGWTEDDCMLDGKLKSTFKFFVSFDENS